MDNDERIVKIAYNPNFCNKIPNNGDKRFFSEDWTNIELSIEDFIKLIQNGWAYCPQLTGTRKKENYLLSNIVSIDIDSGHSINEILEEDFIKKHLSILYTTTNHTIDDHRFRLIFICDEDIDDPELQTRLNQALTYKFNGDRSSTDPARLFFGNTESNPMTFSGMLSKNIIHELIELAKIPPSDPLFNQKGISTYSKFNLDPSYVVKDENGISFSLKDIKDKASIYCPFHYDKNPSAFVKREANKPAFLHCVKCKQTWWEKSPLIINYRNKILPDFSETIKDIDNYIANNIEHQEFLLSKVKDDPIFGTERIKQLKLSKFKLSDIHKGITFIKSPKGSGKTTSLTEAMLPLISKFKTYDFYEEYVDELPISFDTDYKVLLIGHRQALIRDLCNRLGLHCYLDDDSNKSKSIPKKTLMRRYGVCLDSLWRVQEYDFDLIIIDESEQVLSHFLSSTMDKREWNFSLLASIIRRTPSVVALDADLGWLSYLTLCRMKNIHSFSDSENNQSWIYLNEYPVTDLSIEIYDSINHLTSILENDISENRKVFVASNSKKLIDKLYTAAKDIRSDKNKMICITSENSKDNEIQDFINNIKIRAPEYQAIFCSPSMGTGIDISFDDKYDEIDCVYGFFEGNITTHTEIDQQLARVRKPKNVRCYISKRRFNYETDFDVVKTDLLTNHIIANTTIGFHPVTHKELFNEEDEFLGMATLVLSQQRESKNNLYENFIEYKTNNGYKCIIINKDDEISVSGSTFIKTGKLNHKLDTAERLISALPIDRYDYIDIKEKLENNEWVSQDLRLSYRRIQIEKFYSEKISSDLINIDDEGNFRSKIMMFDFLTDILKFNNNYELQKLYKHKKNTAKMKIIKDPNAGIVLLSDLLSTAGIYKNHTFLTNIEFSSETLKDFIAKSVEYKKYQEGLLGINVQSDIYEKPTQHLSKLLNLVGLKQNPSRKEQVSGIRRNLYKIDKDRLDLVLSIVERRKQYAEDRWDFIHQLHGRSLSNSVITYSPLENLD
jgi:hypothetical protein